MKLEERIQRLEDRAEIEELPARYCVACDDRDTTGLLRLFTGDGVFKHADGSVRASGQDELNSFYRTRLAAQGVTIHTVHSSIIEFTGPNEATGIVQGHVELALEGKTVIGALRYHDRYVRGETFWQFVERELRYWYHVPADELVSALVTEKRRWWPGEPVATVLPDTVPSWKEFYG